MVQSCFSQFSWVQIGKSQCPSLRKIPKFFKTLLTLNPSVLLRWVLWHYNIEKTANICFGSLYEAETAKNTTVGSHFLPAVHSKIVKMKKISPPWHCLCTGLVLDFFHFYLSSQLFYRTQYAASVMSLFNKRVTAGVWPGVVILTREKTQPPA